MSSSPAASAGARHRASRLPRRRREEPGAPIRIAYNRIAAQTAPCGPWPDQVGQHDREPQLLTPSAAPRSRTSRRSSRIRSTSSIRAAMTPPDATRRAVVLDKYREGRDIRRRLFERDGRRDRDRELATNEQPSLRSTSSRPADDAEPAADTLGRCRGRSRASRSRPSANRRSSPPRSRPPPATGAWRAPTSRSTSAASPPRPSSTRARRRPI